MVADETEECAVWRALEMLVPSLISIDMCMASKQQLTWACLLAPIRLMLASNMCRLPYHRIPGSVYISILLQPSSSH